MPEFCNKGLGSFWELELLAKYSSAWANIDDLEPAAAAGVAEDKGRWSLSGLVTLESRASLPDFSESGQMTRSRDKMIKLN